MYLFVLIINDYNTNYEIENSYKCGLSLINNDENLNLNQPDTDIHNNF